MIEKNIQSVLKELEKTSDKFWNIPPETGILLNSLIKTANYKNILEIGSSNGYSAIWLAEAARQTSGHVTGIEFYPERINLAESNFEKCGLSKYITIKQGKALDILANLDQELDFVFIDANKSEYIKYFEIVHKILKAKGLIAADNVTSHKEELQDFIDLITEHTEYQTSYLPYGGGLLLAFKV